MRIYFGVVAAGFLCLLCYCSHHDFTGVFFMFVHMLCFFLSFFFFLTEIFMHNFLLFFEVVKRPEVVAFCCCC